MNKSRDSIKQILLIIFYIVLIALIGFPFIQSLALPPQVDEPITYYIVKSDFWEMVRRGFRYQPTPPGYYFLAFSFAQIFGASYLSLRIFSMLCVAATFWVISRVFKNLGIWSRWHVLFIAFTYSYAASLGFIFQARCYTLLLLVGSLNLYICTASRYIKSSSFPFIFGGLLALSIYIHYFAVLFVPVYIFLTLKFNDQKNKYLKILKALLLAGTLCLPLLPHFNFHSRLADVYRLSDGADFFSYINSIFSPLLLLGLVICIPPILYLREAYDSKIINSIIGGFAMVFLNCSLLYIFSILFKTSFLVDRYLSLNVIGMTLIMSGLLMLNKDVRLQFILIFGLIIFLYSYKQVTDTKSVVALKYANINKCPVILSPALAELISPDMFEEKLNYDFLLEFANSTWLKSENVIMMPPVIIDREGLDYFNRQISQLLKYNCVVVISKQILTYNFKRDFVIVANPKIKKRFLESDFKLKLEHMGAWEKIQYYEK